LIAHERHVTDDVRARCSADDSACVIRDLVERDGERVRLTLDDHPEGVADQHRVHTGFVHQPRHGEIVCRHHYDGGLTGRDFTCAELGNGDLATGIGAGSVHFSSGRGRKRSPVHA
jgi:hypothetical protein